MVLDHTFSFLFFSYVWLGAGREIENYRGTLICIFVFEIGRHIVGLCMSSIAEIAANAQLTLFSYLRRLLCECYFAS